MFWRKAYIRFVSAEMIGSIGVSITHKQHKIIKSKLEKGFCTHAFGVTLSIYKFIICTVVLQYQRTIQISIEKHLIKVDKHFFIYRKFIANICISTIRLFGLGGISVDG